MSSGTAVLVAKYFGLAFSALLPVVNPLGSALFILGLVGTEPPNVFRRLARRIAINSVLFLLVVELVGSAMLAFFGVSLPVVQLAGGLVLSVVGWQLLNQKEYQANAKVSSIDPDGDSLADKVFYPLTFPITVDPACIVVTLTLAAHASREKVVNNVLAHVGILLGIVTVSFSVFLCYTYAPKITQKISPQTVHGILRVIAFVLLCIGVQIGWNGLDALLQNVHK
ncbi:MAG TPA: MarC family protein [Terriglobales bacterium]|nr:MarC family protein [Terriglobales bacterium]